MKSTLRERYFPPSAPVAGGQIIPPDLGPDPGPAPGPVKDPDVEKYAPLSKRFKGGPRVPQELQKPDLDDTSGGGGKGGGGGKVVPYPDLPDIKACDPRSLRYARRCPNNSVEKGCGGQNVQEIQVQLIRKGFDLPRWKADCKFGDETKGAVQDFQESLGFPNTGIVDQRTYNKLFAGSDGPTSISATPGSSGPAPAAAPTAASAGSSRGIIPPSLDENKNIFRNRYNEIERLVIERMVKGCK